ncbi:TatD family hydrolase [Pelagibacterium montanilacus]|uniref:TatD family hydrolase n=1 Tax=Pelagibacterium montanilacus TaxID=2185280 RepID=UPI000F8EFBA4|nr:TatD family hydrolase [Pelagibacterium montanilacus]
MLIDSHCHLDFDVLQDDLEGVVARARENGVTGMVTISTRIAKFSALVGIAERMGNVWCTVGTHPHNAHEELDISAQKIIELSRHPLCVGIGEAGLDYHYDSSPRNAQAQGFRAHITAARETGLPLVIHARAADEDMISILEEETGQGAFPFVLHCFSSGRALAERGLELGGYVSFSGIVTFKNAAEIQDVARMVPADRFLVETDAPYLAPVPFRGKPNQPAYVRHTAGKVAELRGETLETIAEQSTANFFRLFSKARLAQ